jgi:outer membrane protein OmpA-like peptidoglycan-associated protein
VVRPAIAPPLSPPSNVDLKSAPVIALGDGLTLVAAVTEELGDYESVARVSSSSADRVRVSYSATVPLDGKPSEQRGERTVLTNDLASARVYRVKWLAGRSELARGTTALGISTTVFDELKSAGRSECSLASIDFAGALLGVTGLGSPEYEGVLERIDPSPVPVAVVLDGVRTWLPALRANGTFEGLSGDVAAEFWFLDNRDNPLTLRAVIGQAQKVVVRIDRPLTREALALDSGEAIDLPGVYFEFASATLRPESAPAIAQLADILDRHPDWRLRFGGHTDNIGSADANLKLSRARAAAVRDAIVSAGSGKLADRLEADGFGATHPRESNDTPEGRARNRRVEASRIK